MRTALFCLLFVLGAALLPSSGAHTLQQAAWIKAIGLQPQAAEWSVWVDGPKQFLTLSQLEAMAQGAERNLALHGATEQRLSGAWHRRVTLISGDWSIEAESLRLKPYGSSETFVVIDHTISRPEVRSARQHMMDAAGRMGAQRSDLTLRGTADASLAAFEATCRQAMANLGATPVYFMDAPSEYTLWAYVPGGPVPVQIAGKWINMELVARKKPGAPLRIALGEPFVLARHVEGKQHGKHLDPRGPAH